MANISELLRTGRGKGLALLCVIALVTSAGIAFRHRHRASVEPASSGGSKPIAAPVPRDLAAEKARTEAEAAKQRAEAARPFILAASKHDKEQLQSLMTAYSTALKPIREPPLLDLTPVTEIDQLHQKQQLVQSFIKANDALRSFLDGREQNYRETLLELGLPSQSLETVMEAYRQTAAQPTSLALKMRNDDTKMAAALLDMLALLEANWGQWKFNPAKQKVEFSAHAAQEEFLDRKEALDQASLEQMACQVKLTALESSR